MKRKEIEKNKIIIMGFFTMILAITHHYLLILFQYTRVYFTEMLLFGFPVSAFFVDVVLWAEILFILLLVILRKDDDKEKD